MAMVDAELSGWLRAVTAALSLAGFGRSANDPGPVSPCLTDIHHHELDTEHPEVKRALDLLPSFWACAGPPQASRTALGEHTRFTMPRPWRPGGGQVMERCVGSDRWVVGP